MPSKLQSMVRKSNRFASFEATTGCGKTNRNDFAATEPPAGTVKLQCSGCAAGSCTLTDVGYRMGCEGPLLVLSVPTSAVTTMSKCLPGCRCDAAYDSTNSFHGVCAEAR